VLRESRQRIWMPIAERAAQAYVAGPSLADALHALRQLNHEGYRGTIGYWNADADSPRRSASLALAALDALADPLVDGTLSVKAAALGFDPSIVSQVLGHAKRRGIGVHFDALGAEAVDRTFALIASGLSRHESLGCTLPGRWRRSLADAETAIELGISVRVVKGQWSAPGTTGVDPRFGFLDVIDRLAGRAVRVGVATHDAPLARKALARLDAAGTTSELEVLFGWNAAPAIREAVTIGVPVRVYVPYGHAHLPYALSHAGQDVRVLWWIVRDVVRGRHA
jgi:proline dehydrogenase